MKKETFLPLFMGFYGTFLEPDESQEMEHVNEIRREKGWKDADFNDFAFNYTAYYRKAGKNACNYVERLLNELGLGCSITFQQIVHPQEYNFVNDDVEISINFKAKQLRQLFKECDCAEYLEEKHKSRDGFISFYPYSKKWWEKCKLDQTTTGCLLEAILATHPNSEWKEEDFIDAALHEATIECGNYERLTEGKTFS